MDAKEIEQRYYTVKDAAKYLGLPETELRRYAREGKLQYSRPGGKVLLFDKADLLLFIEKSKGK